MPSSQFGQTRRPSNWDNWSLAAESNSQYYNQIVTVLMTISVAASFGTVLFFGTLLTTNCLGCLRCSEKRRRGEGNILSGNCCDHYPWPLLATARKTPFFIFYQALFLNICLADPNRIKRHQVKAAENDRGTTCP